MQTVHPVSSERTYKQYVLIVLPFVLIPGMYIVYQGFVAAWGPKTGYLAAFTFYWLVGCLLLPFWLLGREGLWALFRRVQAPFGYPVWVGATMLLWPPLLAGLTALPLKFPLITLPVLLGSAALAVVNATLEEVLWRGAYIWAFPHQKLWGWIYPSIGFALWHIAPQSIHGNPMPGGVASYLLSAWAIGLAYGWVAWRTGSIRWTVISHVTLNFLGMGATLYFA